MKTVANNLRLDRPIWNTDEQETISLATSQS